MTNDKFREAIDIQLGDLDIKTKDELKTLMRHRKFLTGKTPEKQANQLNGAWNYLRSKYGQVSVTYGDRIRPKEPDTITISVKGFKRRQVRNAKGQIVRWE